MKQHYNQQQANLNEQTTLIRQETTHLSNMPQTLAGAAKNRIMNKIGMSEQEWAVYDAELSIGLLTLRTAFPTQTRNYSEREHDVLTALWLDIFAETEQGLLREAIMRFISTDHKGFFPTPGQIMSIAEEITAEHKRQAEAESTERHYAYLRELQKRINNGENCSTCRFCEHREVVDTQEKEMKLFCQNSESYKHEGEYGYGTSATILCDYYESKNEK